MNELLGLAYYAEIPGRDHRRAARRPSTGMPTRTQQGDILLECAYASHGDTKHILLFPANPGECFEFAVKAFDLAERFQTPVFMLSDLDIGMNDWVCPPQVGRFELPPDRGRVLTRRSSKRCRSSIATAEDETRRRAHAARRARKGAFFTRGSGHNKFGGYTEIPTNTRK
jgi:2-oxoglutarate/2-oxoacid ferredoxin oxidoreductase subunit alpha